MDNKGRGYGENLLVTTKLQCLTVNTNRDRDAWLSVLTAVITVDPVAERADAG